ncbi:hypothetical protein [Pseudomonas syringae]|uniref:Uncharacterized protein n=3 Tax=Pseudomonas syringae TaxID=317 RepID=A0A656JUK6_PSESF|nr:hypothetical protein [Pseudomonas syringae]EPN55383.1 hypothetical protein A245_23294 [Pseudomonas syringae pv. actinidiae ICMP 19096]EPM48012.1 hypothetical protein A246_13189 [Pseudomonas syringae pv. actinidiae ICMP 19098]EPM98299.1 hypothetical protein A249_18520 [Pseudomonas syringae pv. actinidiae ICMP 18804]EPN18731.1 hypothetical protein A248_12777 [Pseudomonas syringae pv. actinidiae ICMP 19100]EPN26176.1 hypothetical protein A247_12932 [Pseudomonas syringae pv. actinidiae ICMP 190
MDAAPRTSKISAIFARISIGISGMIGVIWSIFTYLFPDPAILGLRVDFINWKTLIIIVSTVMVLSGLYIAFLARKLPSVLKLGVWLALALFLCAVFFKLGGEYAKPSVDFARSQTLFTENDNANIFGKRSENVDNLDIELLGCDQNGQSPTCTLELTNKSADRDFRFVNPISLFEETGGALGLSQMRVGDAKSDRWDNFQLIRNVPTRVTMTFEAAKGKVKQSPALKLSFRDRENKDHVLKFNEVKVN